MACFYIQDVDRGRVQTTTTFSFAAQKTVASGFFFSEAHHLQHPEMGGPFFDRLLKRFEAEDAQSLFDTMTQAVGKAVPILQPQSKRSSKMNEAAPKEQIDIEPDDIIRINKEFDGRARRPGSKAETIFKLYRDGMKVSTWLEKASDAGGSMRHLRKDVRYGRVSLERKAA
jgi:hypothetical protein